MPVRNALLWWVNWGLGGIVTTMMLALVGIRLFVGSFSVIPQNGMYPGLPAGSRVFGLRQPYSDVSQVARGDIVLFERHEKGRRYIYIWRVVGLPGETVKVDGDSLSVNDKAVVREEVRSEGDFVIYRESLGNAAYEVAFGPEVPPGIPKSVNVVVPQDQVFVMGDNRHNAVDSRTFGPIPFSSIVAKKW